LEEEAYIAGLSDGWTDGDHGNTPCLWGFHLRDERHTLDNLPATFQYDRGGGGTYWNSDAHRRVDFTLQEVYLPVGSPTVDTIQNAQDKRPWDRMLLLKAATDARYGPSKRYVHD
jgi:glucose dehydrogenase